MKKVKGSELSKFLSLVLRHKPDSIQLELNEYGYAKIDDLINNSFTSNIKIDREELFAVVESNNKKRFLIKGNRIRATQGHSFPVKLEIKATKPPSLLYHGTLKSLFKTIEVEGIKRMQRSHVHMNSDFTKSYITGSRTSKEPTVVQVLAGEMFKDGYHFFQTENNVWLTEFVPSKYIRKRALDEEYEINEIQIFKRTKFEKLGKITLDKSNLKRTSFLLQRGKCYICKKHISSFTFEKDKVICEEISLEKHKEKHYIPGKCVTIDCQDEEKYVTITFKGRISYDSKSIEIFRKEIEDQDDGFEGTGLWYNCGACGNLNMISNISNENQSFACSICQVDTLKQIGKTEIIIENCI